MKKKKERKDRLMPVWCGILVFILAFLLGAASKVLIKPSWSKNYSVKWDESIGTLIEDLSYGDGEANKYDLYLPKDNTKDHYGLAVYLHAGGFTAGDKAGDRDMLAWLCSKGYVAVGINYTLAAELSPGQTNGTSVLTQSNEIKAAIPVILEEAERSGYRIDQMCIAGGSAGHALAMIYAYRDSEESPVPVALTFGAVGPSSFYKEDWDNYGLDRETEEAYAGTAVLFSAMLGEVLSVEEVKDGSYLEKMKPVSAASWVTPDSPPTVVAYGTHDRIQPYKASLRLKTALEENNVDFRYFEMTHSGHGLQNDSALYKQWFESVEEYLDRYMPVE